MLLRSGDEKTADPSTALLSGRDDKGDGRYRTLLRSGDEKTAGPFTALRYGRDDKGDGRYRMLLRSGDEKTADLSTSLRSGRDDSSLQGRGKTVPCVHGLEAQRSAHTDASLWLQML
jgi:hypothetical protein